MITKSLLIFFFNFKKQAENSFFEDILAKNHLHIWAKNIKRTLVLSPYKQTMTQNEKTLGQKVDEMTNKISEVSSELGEKLESSKRETQKFAHGVAKWRVHASIETRITTIVGALLIAVAFWNLRMILWQLLLLTLGILSITGVFNSFVNDALEFLRDKLNAQAKKSTPKKEESEK